MSFKDDANKVVRNIVAVYGRRDAAVYAYCLEYAAIMLNYFRVEQRGNRFWNNETFQAFERFFAKAMKENRVYFIRVGHGVEYGPYLELANDRKNEAIRPIIQRYAGRFINTVKRLFVG
jgi:hypothetical protein